MPNLSVRPCPNDPFPAARIVVSDLGEPDAPAELIAGDDVRHDGMITFASLQTIARENA